MYLNTLVVVLGMLVGPIQTTCWEVDCHKDVLLCLHPHVELREVQLICHLRTAHAVCHHRHGLPNSAHHMGLPVLVCSTPEMSAKTGNLYRMSNGVDVYAELLVS